MKGILKVFFLLTILVFLVYSMPSFASWDFKFSISTPRIFGPKDKEIYINLSSKGVRYVDIKIYKLKEPLKFIINSKYKQNLRSYKFSYRLDLKEQILNDLWERLNNLQYSIRIGLRRMIPYDERVKIKELFGIKEFKEFSVPEPPLNIRVNKFLRDEEVLYFFREYVPKPKDKNWWSYRRILLPIKDVGTYLVEASYNGKVAYTLVMVNKISIAVKATATTGKFLVFLENKYTSTPLEGGDIYIVRRDKILAKGKTGKDGIYFLKHIDFSMKDIYVIAAYGKEITISNAPYLYSENANFEIYTYTDRPIYKPGHIVYFKTILRQNNIYTYSLPPVGEKVKVSLRDPDYNLILEKEETIDEFGTISDKIELSEDAALGYYTISVEYKDNRDTAYFQVEDYEKPDFELKTSSSKKIYKKGDNIDVEVGANYYFGEPLRDGKIEYQIFAYPISETYYNEDNEIFLKEGSGHFDTNGKFHLVITPKELQDLPNSTIYINFYAKDWKNKLVTTNYSVEYRATDFLLDIETNQYLYSKNGKVRVDIKAFDIDKKPVDTKVTLIVKHILWKDNSRIKKIEKVTEIETIEGNYEYIFTPKTTGSYEIEAQARDKNRNLIKAYTYIWVSGGIVNYYTEDIRFITDKKSYKQGDVAHIVVILPRKNVTALYTLEGKDIYEYKILKAQGNVINLDIPLFKSYIGDLKVKFLFFSKGSYYEGYESLKVENTKYKLSVDIIPDKKVYKPGEEGLILVKVKDSQGKGVKAQVSLGIVDESIYALASDYEDTLFDYFYTFASNYYDVSTRISYYFNFYGSAFNEAIIDAKKKDEHPLADFKAEEPMGRGEAGIAPHVRRFFPDTMYFNPTIVTDENGIAKVKVVFPDSLTSFRITAKAITKDTKVGQTKRNVYVKKDIFSRMDFPPFGVVGDEVFVSGIVHNYTDIEKDLDIKIKTSQNIKLESDSPYKEVQIPSGREKVASFKTKLNSHGKGIVRIDVRDSGKIYDALERSFTIFPYGYHVKSIDSNVLKDNKTEFSLKIPKDLIPNTITSRLEIDTSVIATLIPSFKYLIGYPYGCTEQTMSRLLPDIAVEKLLNIYNISPKGLEDINKMIVKGIRRLYRYQHDDGGWGWWEFDDSSITQTAYVLFGLSLLKKNDYLVSDNALVRGFRYLFDNITQEENLKNLNEIEKSFALYALSLWENTSSQRKMSIKKLAKDVFEDMISNPGTSSIAFSYMVLALSNLDYGELLNQATYELKKRMHEKDNFAYWDGYFKGYYYITDIEATAWGGIALSSASSSNDLLNKIANYILSFKMGDGWINTKSTAISLLYLARYLKKEEKTSGKWAFDVYVGKKKIGTYEGDKPDTLSLLIPIQSILNGEKIRIDKKKGDIFYYRIYMDYWKRKAPSTLGPKISIHYYKAIPHLIDEEYVFTKENVKEAFDLNDITVSDISVKTDRDLYNVIVEVPRPSGFEYLKDDWNYKFVDENEDENDSFWYIFKEYRKDKVVFFIDYIPRGEIHFKYMARARAKGKFYVLPPRLTLMYDPHIVGFGEKDVVIIK